MFKLSSVLNIYNIFDGKGKYQSEYGTIKFSSNSSNIKQYNKCSSSGYTAQLSDFPF